MPPKVRLMGAATAVILLSALVTAAPTIARAATERLPSSVAAAPNGVIDLGPVAADRVLQVSVTAVRPSPQAEARLAADLYNPASPAFHRFVSPAEYAARFGVPASRATATRKFLTDGGLHVTYEEPTHFRWAATGSAADIGHLFHTQLHEFRDGSRTYYANTAAPTVPSDLGIDRVGLTDRFRLKTASFPVSATTTPADLWSIYHQPAGNTGEGEQVALFGWGVSDGVESDLRIFEDMFRLPRMPFRIQRVGAAPDPTDTGGKIEWDLDSQASSGMAPGLAGETFYFSTSSNVDDGLDGLSTWINDAKGAHQGSASYGLCEANPVSSNYTESFNDVLRQAVAEGRTLFASSGDTGSGCPPEGAGVNGVTIGPEPAQEVPAASPYAVGVGGTVLTTADGANPAQRDVEYAWTHGGGGPSLWIAAPGYQAGVDAINRPCLATTTGVLNSGGTTCRGVPDVAAQSGDLASGYTVVSDGSPGAVGGTSLASPLWVGMWSRVQAASSGLTILANRHDRRRRTTTTYPGLGFANPSFYAIGRDPARYAKDFTDITMGANGTNVAGPGWDYTTGWGVPDVTNLSIDLNHGVKPTHSQLGPEAGPADSTMPIDPCAALWTDPAGDVADPSTQATTGEPQEDLLASWAAMSDDGKAIRIRLQVADLEQLPPSGASFSDYYTYFDVAGTTHDAFVSIASDGSVAYGDDGNGNAPTTGSVTKGSPGYVEVDVPTTNFDLAPGARLRSIHSVAFVADDPADLTGLDADDGGPGQEFAVGQRCGSPPPTDPEATPQPAPLISSPACSVTDPTGDATEFASADVPAPNEPTLDVTAAHFRWDRARQVLTSTVSVADLSDTPPPAADGRQFRTYFTYKGVQYFLSAVDSSGTKSYKLEIPGTPENTVLDDTLTGSFDVQHKQVSIDLPAASFAKAVPGGSLATGTTLHGLDIQSRRDQVALAPIADDAPASCEYVLG